MSETTDITDRCSLSVLVPENSNFDPSTYLSASDSQEREQNVQLPISAVPTRRFLYFGVLLCLELSIQPSYSFSGFYQMSLCLYM